MIFALDICVRLGVIPWLVLVVFETLHEHDGGNV